MRYVSYDRTYQGLAVRTQEHVADGTGTGWINGAVTLDTTHTGTTYSLKDPTYTNLSCQNLTGNATFTGPDDVWGTGMGTDPRDRLRRRALRRADPGQDAVAVARAQRPWRRRPHAGRHLRQRHPGIRGRHVRRGTEWFADNPNDPPDYTVGEEVNLVGSGPIRYMDNPSLAGDDNC